MTARCQVLVDAGRVDAGRQHCVPLRRQRLGTVRLGDTDIANQHRGTGRASGKKKPTLQAWRSIPQRVFWRISCGGNWPDERGRHETARFSGALSTPTPRDAIRLTHFASERSISRPSHRSCAQSQTACVEITLQSQLICTGNRP